MEQVKLKYIKALIIALISVCILSIGHAFNIQVLLWGTLIIFSGLILISPKEFFLPLMLFYLPWSPILKASSDSFTFFTLVVPAVFVLLILEGFKTHSKFKKEQLILLLFFTSYTLFVKWLNALPIQMPYIFFIMMFFFIPIYTQKYKSKINFEMCTLYLTAGVLSACIAAEVLMSYPHMLEYINVYKWEQIGLTRLSGFYGDANFYSAQILVAVASLLIVLSKTRIKALIALQITSIIALLYYGMQSVSKMFIFCVAGIALLWIFILLMERRSVIYKFGMVLTLAIAVVISIKSNLFSDQINNYLLRFGLVTDTQSLTTGRSDLVAGYIEYLMSHVGKLLFGIGLSVEFLEDESSHNTVVQIIYQVGVIGSVFIIAWWKMVYSNLSNRVKLGFIEKFYMLIFIISGFFPWLALDMLYFDEFFYVTLLAILARNYISKRQLANNNIEK